MSKPSAPSMPTPRQIEEAYKIASTLNPGARVVRVGPDGVTFDYPDMHNPDAKYQGKPFGSAA